MKSASGVSIRTAIVSDVAAMTRIYSHHVLNGTGSFEELAPAEHTMRERFELREADSYPTLLAEVNGQVVGFAYAGNYKARSAYRFTVEDSIYVAPDATGMGVGAALLNELISVCSSSGYRQMMAVIGDSANVASIGLHERCGFTLIGTARELGYKHGRWLDIVYMQRSL